MGMNFKKLKSLKSTFLFSFLLAFISCTTPESSKIDAPPNSSQESLSCFDQLGANTEWSAESEIFIDGYNANAMEPKTSADGVVLFWNDKPSSDSLMNIHYAIKQSNGRYSYVGTLPGSVNANFLDGVPAIDSAGNFYFVSIRSYATNFQSIFGGQIQVLGPNSLQVVNVSPADANVTQNQNGKLDMDIDISWDGGTLIASRASFSGNAYPDSSQLALFNVSSRIASPSSNSDQLLENINLKACRVYAGTLSNDLRELYFTAIPMKTANAEDFRVVVAKRASTSVPFGIGNIIQGISGSVTEGPALSMDGKTLFYHKLDQLTGRYKLYKVSRP